MAKWNLFCAKHDYPMPPSPSATYTRIRQGDIVFVQPAKDPINPRDRKRYIIVPVDNLTADEAYMLQNPQWSNGMDTFNPGKDKKNPPTVVAKRKHAVPFSKMEDQLPFFDDKEASDPSKNYQPYLLTETIKNPKTDATVYDKHDESYRTDFTPSTGTTPTP